MLTAISFTIELNRRKSAEKQRRLAGQVTDGALLISAIRFYVAELRDHEPENARDIDGKARQLTKGCQLYWRPSGERPALLWEFDLIIKRRATGCRRITGDG